MYNYLLRRYMRRVIVVTPDYVEVAAFASTIPVEPIYWAVHRHPDASIDCEPQILTTLQCVYPDDQRVWLNLPGGVRPNWDRDTLRELFVFDEEG